MRAFVPAYQMKTPETLGEALTLTSDGWKPFAGGTDLMVLLEAGKLYHRRFIGLWKLAELRGVRATPDTLAIGALTTYTDIRNSAVLREEFPLLVAAAAETGGIATQNRGTLGGNIANASPAGDSLPPLLVYDAVIELESKHGAKRVDYAHFHTGYKQMALAPGEIITRIHLPRNKQRWQQTYRKVGTRKAQAISKVCLAAAAKVAYGAIADISIAYGSVAPVPLRCLAAEAALRGSRLDDLPEIPDETTPVDDMRSTSRYRRRVARNLLDEFLRSLA